MNGKKLIMSEVSDETNIIYLVWFTAFHVIGFPFTVKTHNFTTFKKRSSFS